MPAIIDHPALSLGAGHLEFIIPGPQAHWAKLAFEKYFLYSRKHGHV